MYKYKLIGNNINLCIIIGTLVTFFITGVNQSFAQSLPKQYLRIAPIIQDITLTKGTPYTYPLIIENLADKPMGIHIDINGFDPSQEVHQGSFTPQNSPLVSWTQISDNDLVIPALSQKQVTISITAPEDVKNGGYYETFTITPFMSNQQNAKSPVVLTRFLAVVFATVGKVDYSNLGKKVTIQKFGTDSFVIPTTNAHLVLEVDNSYFTHFIAKPFITLSPLFGKQQIIPLDEKHIFPGSNRTWNISLNLPTNYVFYKAQATIYIGNGEKITSQTKFIVLPKQLILAAIIAFVLISITLLRKRLWKFIKILLKG